MVIIAVASLLFGVICGRWGFPPELSAFFVEHSEVVLWILMFSVGISVGQSQGIWRRVQQYHLKILLIPLCVIFASALSGIFCALLTGYPLGTGMAISSAMGWYSLSGVLLTELAGAQVGTVAFLANLLREILAFLLIPLLVKHLHPLTAIAAAGATSEDTTLPMLIKYTNSEMVILSVFNGVVCSAAVPLLIRLFCMALPA